MSYTNTVTILDLEGGNGNLKVTSKLWMLWYVGGTGSGTGNQQSEQGSIDVEVKTDSSSASQIFFHRDADFSDAKKGVGISVQDQFLANRDRGGWLFRSGSFPGVLPSEPIDIITAKKDFTAAEFQALLPALPIIIDSTTSITGLTATLVQGGVDIVAMGTTTKTGVIIGFTYTGTIMLEPSSDIEEAANEAINMGIANPKLLFTAGPSVLSAVEAEILNSLQVFIMRSLNPMLRSRLEKMLNTALASAVGKALPGGALPAGVFISVRNITITPENIKIRAALGAFGGVINKFPVEVIKTNPIKCFIATSVYGANSTEVQVLRTFRDIHLLTNKTGRRFVSLYETWSPNIATFISKKPIFRVLMKLTVVWPAFKIAKIILSKGKK